MLRLWCDAAAVAAVVVGDDGDCRYMCGCIGGSVRFAVVMVVEMSEVMPQTATTARCLRPRHVKLDHHTSAVCVCTIKTTTHRPENIILFAQFLRFGPPALDRPHSSKASPRSTIEPHTLQRIKFVIFARSTDITSMNKFCLVGFDRFSGWVSQVIQLL